MSSGISANASAVDVEANQADIVALQSSVNAKPRVDQVNTQIGVPNSGQNQATSLQYQDRATNYDISQTDGCCCRKRVLVVWRLYRHKFKICPV